MLIVFVCGWDCVWMGDCCVGRVWSVIFRRFDGVGEICWWLFDKFSLVWFGILVVYFNWVVWGGWCGCKLDDY